MRSVFDDPVLGQNFETDRLIGAFDDFQLQGTAHLYCGGGGGFSLIAALGEDPFDEREQPPRGFEDEQTAVAILDAGGMNHGFTGRPGCRPGYVAAFPRLSSPRHSPTRRSAPPFFGAFDALAVDDRGCRAGLLALLLARADEERAMQPRQRAHPIPTDRDTRRPWFAAENPLAKCATESPFREDTGLRSELRACP